MDVTSIIKVMTANSANAKSLIAHVAPTLAEARAAPCPHLCDRALEYAIITQPDARDPKTVATLDAVAGRVL